MTTKREVSVKSTKWLHVPQYYISMQKLKPLLQIAKGNVGLTDTMEEIWGGMGKTSEGKYEYVTKMCRNENVMIK